MTTAVTVVIRYRSDADELELDALDRLLTRLAEQVDADVEIHYEDLLERGDS